MEVLLQGDSRVQVAELEGEGHQQTVDEVDLSVTVDSGLPASVLQNNTINHSHFGNRRGFLIFALLLIKHKIWGTIAEE